MSKTQDYSNKKCALVLAGCGAKDGAEITEAVSLMIAFSQKGYHVEIFAPDREVHHVINHITGDEVTAESRNILVEASRIARGKIKPISEISSNDFDVLCFAGGFGVAKNLCNFAFAGQDALLENDVKKVIFEFIHAHKIVSALCIAPILIAIAAKELNLKDVKITVGSGQSDAAKIINSWGLHHEDKQVFEASVDLKNKFVTAPAYMDDKATPADIFASASALVNGLSQFFNT